MPLQRPLDELERRGPAPILGDEGFQHLALVVDSPPEIAHLAVDLHVDLVKMPAPVGVGAHVLDPLPADLAGEHRAEAVPPEPHGLMADVDAALEQEILDVAQRQGVDPMRSG